MWKKFRISFLIVVVLIIVFSIIEIRRDNPVLIIRQMVRRGSLEGDKLKFKAKFLGAITIGEATVENKGIENLQGKSAYHLIVYGKSARWLSAFFKAEATCDSYIDKNKLHSLQFRQHIIISEHPREDKIVNYDQINLIMDIEGEKRQILPNTHDPLSLMFYLQKQTFSLGKEFDLNINTNQKNYQFKAKVVEKKTYKIGDKNIYAWVVKAEVGRRDKEGRNKSSATMWLLDNPSKTPILFKVMTKIGPITIRLTEAN